MGKFFLTILGASAVVFLSGCATKGKLINLSPYPIEVSSCQQTSSSVETKIVMPLASFEFTCDFTMPMEIHIPQTEITYKYIIDSMPERIAFYEQGNVGIVDEKIKGGDFVMLYPNENNCVYLNARQGE